MLLKRINNGAIEIKFNDRTHLRMIKDLPNFKLISSTGHEFKFKLGEEMAISQTDMQMIQNYVKIGLQYIEWAYMSQEERYKREMEEHIAQ